MCVSVFGLMHTGGTRACRHAWVFSPKAHGTGKVRMNHIRINFSSVVAAAAQAALACNLCWRALFEAGSGKGFLHFALCGRFSPNCQNKSVIAVLLNSIKILEGAGYSCIDQVQRTQ